MMAPRPAPEPPYQTVRRLCRDGASGELIFVADDAEVHVYMQSGRLAWATSSRSPLVFSQELIAQTELDRETFRTLLDDCRKSRRPLGETLVSWGLASEGQVRRALEVQLRDALQTLGDQPSGSTLFLERTRAFAHYDQRFTFDGLCMLDELDGASARALSEGAPHSEALCERVLERVPAAQWACTATSEGSTRAAAPEGQRLHLPPQAWQSFGTGVRLAVVRAGRGTALGCADAVGQGEHLWLGLRAEAPLGAALAALYHCLGQRDSNAVGARPSRRGAPAPHTRRSALCTDCDAALRQFLSRTPELRAAAVCADAEPNHLVGRGDDPASEHAVVEAMAHLPLLELGRSAAFHPHPDTLESYGFHFGTMALWLGTGWHFLSEVTDGSGRLLWLWLDGFASQGLGWALTSSLNRLLASQSCCGPSEAHG